MFTTVRSLVAADAASFLRTMGARCAARQLEKVAAGVHLVPSEWEDVLGDVGTVAVHARSDARADARAYSTALLYLSRSNGVGDDLAARELAKLEGETVDQWLDTTREELARRAA